MFKKKMFKKKKQEKAKGIPLIGGINTTATHADIDVLAPQVSDTIYLDGEKFILGTAFLEDRPFVGYFRDGLSEGRRKEEALVFLKKKK